MSGKIIYLEDYREYDLCFLSDTINLIRGFSPGQIFDLEDLLKESKFTSQDAEFWKKIESQFVAKYNTYQCGLKRSRKFK